MCVRCVTEEDVIPTLSREAALLIKMVFIDEVSGYLYFL